VLIDAARSDLKNFPFLRRLFQDEFQNSLTFNSGFSGRLQRLQYIFLTNSSQNGDTRSTFMTDAEAKAAAYETEQRNETDAEAAAARAKNEADAAAYRGAPPGGITPIDITLRGIGIPPPVFWHDRQHSGYCRYFKYGYFRKNACGPWLL
jgi:hypothetical protein